MSILDLAARPIYHCKWDSIDVHRSVVIAVMIVGHELEQRSGLSLGAMVVKVFGAVSSMGSFKRQMAGPLMQA